MLLEHYNEDIMWIVEGETICNGFYDFSKTRRQNFKKFARPFHHLVQA